MKKLCSTGLVYGHEKKLYFPFVCKKSPAELGEGLNKGPLIETWEQRYTGSNLVVAFLSGEIPLLQNLVVCQFLLLNLFLLTWKMK